MANNTPNCRPNSAPSPTFGPLPSPCGRYWRSRASSPTSTCRMRMSSRTLDTSTRTTKCMYVYASAWTILPSTITIPLFHMPVRRNCCPCPWTVRERFTIWCASAGSATSRVARISGKYIYFCSARISASSPAHRRWCIESKTAGIIIINKYYADSILAHTLSPVHIHISYIIWQSYWKKNNNYTMRILCIYAKMHLKLKQFNDLSKTPTKP